MPLSHRRRDRRLRRARAELVFFGRALRSLLRPALGLVSVALVGAVVHRYFGAPPGGVNPTWAEALFDSYCLLLLEHLDPLPAHPLGQLVQYVQPLLGIFLVAEGIIKLGITVFRKEENAEAWMEIMAHASRGHIILCGVGNVGFRVLEELVRLELEVFAVERDERSSYLERARALGALVLVGDARAEKLLASLNVAQARAAILATDDDLANLEVAMDLRELRADLPIVMRLFDQRLALKVRGALGVDVSVSTSMLAAPLIASAALDQTVVATHRLGDSLVMVVEIVIAPGSRLVGLSVGGLARMHRMTVVGRRIEGGAWSLQPPPEVILGAGDQAQVLVEGARVEVLHALNRPSDP